jgi:signal transduction histidine kinase
VGRRRSGWGSIRFRASAAAALVVAVALVVGGLIVIGQQRRSLTAAIDTALVGRSDDLANLATDAGIPPVITVTGDDKALAQIVDASGRVVASSENIAGEVRISGVQAAAGQIILGTRDSLPVGEGPFRFAARSVDIAGERFTIYVATSLDGVTASVRSLAIRLGSGIPILVLIVALTTWVVVGRTLRPVEAIRAEVAEITGRQLHRRVPEPAVDDEIGRLARTMNDMLGRLERASERQRRFVSDASHELRSPLTSIRAQLEVDLAHSEGVDWHQTGFGVLEETIRLQHLVDDLLLLARSSDRETPIRRESVDLDDVVLAEIARHQTGGRIRIDATAVSGGQVSGDPDELTRAVRNILDNAERHARRLVRISLEETDGAVSLLIEDDGHGVPAAERERIFERFTRADEARSRDQGGSGLGLAITRDIVERHEGTIEVTDGSLGGAAFVIRLPTLLG